MLSDILLMNQIVAIVMEKKRSCSILTFTKVAVRIKSSKIKTILPAILILSAILQIILKDITPQSHCKPDQRHSVSSFFVLTAGREMNSET